MNTLKELRTEHHVSQAKLARRLGVTEKTIANWEAAPVVKPYIVHAYASVFQVPFDALEVDIAGYASGVSEHELAVQPTLPFGETAVEPELVIDLCDIVTGSGTVNFATAA